MTEKVSTVPGPRVPRDEPDRGRPMMRSPAHRTHASMGAVFESRGAWQVPALYGSEDLEREALQTGLGYADVSARGKLHLSGSVEPLLQVLIGHTLEPQRAEAMRSQGLVARVARDWALALVAPSHEGEVLEALERQGDGHEMVTDMTSAMSGFLVAGPRLDDLLARCLTLDLAELKPGTCFAASWARIPAVIVPGILEGGGVELYVGSEYGRYAWDTLRELCGGIGGRPVGWTALEGAGWR
jgi:glycine cleavage system aminomethyltransferase T